MQVFEVLLFQNFYPFVLHSETVEFDYEDVALPPKSYNSISNAVVKRQKTTITAKTFSIPLEINRLASESNLLKTQNEITTATTRL